MPTPLLCPQCGAPLISGACSCPYCQVHFREPGSETPYSSEPAALPPVPEDWVRYANPWAGFALGHPQGWRVVCSQGVINVREDSAGYCSATLYPLRLQTPAAAEQVARQWIGQMTAANPSFSAWKVPSPGGDDRVTLRVQANFMGIQLVGNYFISVHQLDGLISGFQCPTDQIAGRSDDLQLILSTFRPIEQMARLRHVEPAENAFEIWAPEGWNITCGINRNYIGGVAMMQMNCTRDQAGLTQAAIVWLQWNFQEGAMMWGIPTGVPVLPYMPAAQLAQNYIAGWMNQIHQNFQLIGVRDRMDLVPQLAQEYARGGMDPQTVDLSAAMLETSYVENGRRLRQVSRVMVSHPKPMGFFQASGGGIWMAFLDSYIRAPEDEFDALEPVLSGILDSAKSNPAWQQAQTMRNQAYIASQQQDIYNRTRQISQTLSETSNLISQGYWARSESQGRLSNAWSNAILGYQDMSDSSGTIYKVPSGYDQYWRDGLDNIYTGGWLTNPDPTWTRLDPTGQ